MPSQDIPTPDATGAVDRLTLTTETIRGLSTNGVPPGFNSLCFDAEISGVSCLPGLCACFSD
jgi:hypothetical protein